MDLFRAKKTIISGRDEFKRRELFDAPTPWSGMVFD
jgi:hypothetical protein